MKVSIPAFLSRAEEIAAEEPAYRAGHDGSDGWCDCIGLIIGAIRRAGGEWPGTHGSNYAARYETESLSGIGSAASLRIGEAVFKCREPGEKGYALPEKYRRGGGSCTGDLRDYYHVGVVLSASPLRIRHMTSPKPKLDMALGQWKYHGKLKRAGEEREDEGMGERIVLSGGNPDLPIRLRAGAGTDTRILREIPQGAGAELLEAGGEWDRVSCGGAAGYVQSRFVHRQGEEAAASDTVAVRREKLERIYDEIGDWLGLRG